MAVMRSRPTGLTHEPGSGRAGQQSGMWMMPSRHINELAIAEQLGMRRITTRLVDEFGGEYGSGVIEQLISEFLD